jgi:hypothetical protein
LKAVVLWLIYWDESGSKVIFSHPELDSGSVKLLNPNSLDSEINSE